MDTSILLYVHIYLEYVYVLFVPKPPAPDSVIIMNSEKGLKMITVLGKIFVREYS